MKSKDNKNTTDANTGNNENSNTNDNNNDNNNNNSPNDDTHNHSLYVLMLSQKTAHVCDYETTYCPLYAYHTYDLDLINYNSATLGSKCEKKEERGKRKEERGKVKEGKEEKR